MKSYCFFDDLNLHKPGEAWCFIPDSAMLRSGKPVFLTHEDEQYLLCPTVCFRVGRLGKRVAEKFADRYIDSLAPAVVILSQQSAAAVKAGRIPSAAEMIWDGCLVVGDFIDAYPWFQGETDTSLTLTYGKEEKTLTRQPVLPEFAKTELAIASRYNTIKNGDLILSGIALNEAVAEIDTKAECLLGRQLLLRFKVK